MLDDKEKLRALQATLGAIEKQFGKGSVLRLGSNEAVVPMLFRYSCWADCIILKSSLSQREHSNISSELHCDPGVRPCAGEAT